MIFQAFTLYDKKSKQFNIPTFAVNSAVIRRDYLQAVQKDASLQQFCDDYELYLIGEFDTENKQNHFSEPVLQFTLRDLVNDLELAKNG